jgi:adenylate cyclase
MSEEAQFVAWVEKSTADRVPVQGTCSIGRSPANQIVLPDEKVSRRHALIHAQGENEFWLVDLGSANGTYLNDRRVTQPVKLHDQDRIQISHFKVLFRQPRGTRRGQPLDHPTATKTLVEIKSSPCWLLVGDIEDSTTLARKLPPDQLPMVTGRWFSRCKQILEETGGTINKYLGDGFLAYWPEALSNESAVVRALAELKSLQALAQPAFRLVVHHGQVLMGGGGTMGEESLMGNDVNFVFRMEKLAGSLGEVRLLSDAAQSRLKDYLESNACGCHALPSFDGEFPFYRF